MDKLIDRMLRANVDLWLFVGTILTLLAIVTWLFLRYDTLYPLYTR